MFHELAFGVRNTMSLLRDLQFPFGSNESVLKRSAAVPNLKSR